jgi:hypothetical protein
MYLITINLHKNNSIQKVESSDHSKKRGKSEKPKE